MRKIITGYRIVKTALDVFEKAIADADMDDYKPDGQSFIRDMAFCHKRLNDVHVMYEPDVIEAESVMNPKLTTYAMVPGLEVCGASR